MTNNEFVNAITLRVDVFKPSAEYLINDSVRDYGRSFVVSDENINEMILFIKEAGKELGIPIPRIYPSNFSTVKKSDLDTKEQIIERLRYMIYSIAKLEKENATNKKTR